MKKESLKGLPAVIYARYSSHNQNDASIEQQVAKCTEYAQRLGLKLVGVYSDRAMSGKTDRRPDFQKMMRESVKGNFKCVVAWKSNRMGRNMLEAMLNDARLAECGVKTVYVEEDFDDSAAGRFALRNMMNVNQFYSENMAEDIMRGMEDNAKQLKTNGSLPFGYRRGDDGKYEIVEAEADVIREIFSRYASGDTLASITDDLNARGIKTSRGKAWNKNSYHSIFDNERYVGVYIFKETRIDGGVPAIVSRELFDRVQERKGRQGQVKGRRREKNMEYILTGKLFCGECGEPMTGMSGTGRSAMHYYYECRGRRLAHNCKKANVRKDDIELTVAQALKDFVLRDDVIEYIADSAMHLQNRIREDSSVGYYEDKLAVTRKSIGNLLKAVEAGLLTETIRQRMSELEDEREEYERLIELEKTYAPKFTKEQIVFYLEQFREGDASDPKFQKQIFEGFLESVYLYDDHLRITFNFTDGQNTFDLPAKFESYESPAVRLSSPLDHQKQQKRTAVLQMVGQRFVLTLDL